MFTNTIKQHAQWSHVSPESDTTDNYTSIPVYQYIQLNNYVYLLMICLYFSEECVY